MALAKEYPILLEPLCLSLLFILECLKKKSKHQKFLKPFWTKEYFLPDDVVFIAKKI
jgi:hypothetical protein